MASTPFSEGTPVPHYVLATVEHVCRVIDGADSTLDMMEKVPVNEKNRPTEEIRLLNVSFLVTFHQAKLTALQITIHANPVAEAQK